ncbi:hypothetical protein Hanom_Chr12g01134441 [Helianthus anomalus]
MPISNPYHPSHYGGYTRDELLLSLRLQFEILSCQVQDLEFDEGARRSPFPFHPTSAPPPSLLVHASVVSVSTESYFVLYMSFVCTLCVCV